MQPDPDASLSGCSRSEYSIARVRDETLKRHSQSDITKRGWFTDLCDRISPGGRGRFYLCTLPSQRHGTHSETCRSLVWMSAFRAILLQNSKVAAVQIFGENLKRKEVDDSHSFSRATEVAREMSRSLLNIAKRSLPRLTLRGVGLASKDAVG